jgi:hypothetical protein
MFEDTTIRILFCNPATFVFCLSSLYTRSNSTFDLMDVHFVYIKKYLNLSENKRNYFPLFILQPVGLEKFLLQH